MKSRPGPGTGITILRPSLCDSIPLTSWSSPIRRGKLNVSFLPGWEKLGEGEPLDQATVSIGSERHLLEVGVMLSIRSPLH